jgi:hypothetical protein
LFFPDEEHPEGVFMPEKKISGLGISVIAFPRRRRLEKDMSAYLRLGYHSVKPGNQARIINFLKYEKGDSELVQDIKALVIRRIAIEAYSRNNQNVFQAFYDLLGDIPPPIMMRDYMIPEHHRLGEASGFIESCRPHLNDSPLFLRAKREALLFNLAKMLMNLHFPMSSVMNYLCNKTEFKEFFSWVVDLVREHLSSMPPELAQLTNVHVLKPELPFNIQLPD